jgi:hypothetical protein
MKMTAPVSLFAAVALCLSALASVAYANWFAFATNEPVPDGVLQADAIDAWSHEQVGSNPETVSRVVQKQQVAKALIVGDVTLTFAAGRFCELSGAEAPDRLRTIYPGASEVELWHRQVIAFVRALSRDYPDQVAVLIPQLEDEVAWRFSGTAASTVFEPVIVSPGGQSDSRAMTPQTE